MEYRLTAMQEAQRQIIQPDTKFRIDTLNEMIDARILRILARNKGIEADPELVKNEYVAGVMKLGGHEELPAYLDKMKLTEKELLEEINQRMVMEKFIEQLTEGIEITDQEIEDRYMSMRSAGLMERKESTVDFAYIMTRASGEKAGNFAVARQSIYKAHEQLEKGIDPEKVAQQYSEDDLLKVNKGIYKEIIPEKMMLPKTAQQLAELEPGGVLEPFMTADGWHVIKLLGRNEPGTIPLARAHDYVEALLFEEKKEAVLRDEIDRAKLIIRVEIYTTDMQETEDKSQIK